MDTLFTFFVLMGLALTLVVSMTLMLRSLRESNILFSVSYLFSAALSGSALYTIVSYV